MKSGEATVSRCDISVIIPALNEAVGITATVASVAGVPGVEVVVVDGGSRDATVALAKDAGARVVCSPAGRGIQQNVGARHARGRMLLFLHADTRLPAGFADLIRETFAKPGVVAGAFRLAIAATGGRFRLVEWGANLRARWLPYGDQALFVRADLFRSYGGFPEQALLEEVALVRRLRRLGRVVLLPETVLTSARRWQRLGVVRTTLINQTVLLGYFFGVGPARLARWYHGERGQGDGRQAGEQVSGDLLVPDEAKKE